MLKFLRRAAVGTLVLGGTAYSCCYVVRPGEAGIIYNRIFGIQDQTYGEGLHFRIVGLDDVKRFDVRLRPRVLKTMTGTKDLQMVNIRLRVLFRPMPEKLPRIYREFGWDYDERILPSVSNEILKAVVAEYKAEEIIQRRDHVSARIAQLMTEKVANFGIVIEDLSLVDVHFGKEFMLAVEQKQVAQQEAERMKYVVLENEQKKLANIIRAQGEAESAQLISDAVKVHGSGLIELRKIEAAVDIANELTNSPNVGFVPQSGVFLNLK